MTKPALLALRGLRLTCAGNVWLGFLFDQPFFFAFATLAFFFAGSLARVFPKEPAYSLPRFVRRSPLPIRFFLVLRDPQQGRFDVRQLRGSHARDAATAGFRLDSRELGG